MRIRVAGFALLLALASFPAAACDSVTIEYEPGYPAAFPQSVERSKVSVSRCSPQARQHNVAVDTYFDAVRKTLKTANADKDWGFPPPDVPFVKVAIDIDGRQLALIAVSYEEEGLRFSLYPTERDMAHRIAMKTIVSLRCSI